MLKKYKPVTPSLRHRLILKSLKFSLTDRGPGFNKRNLIRGFKKTSGRNNQGRITSFRKGGGHKRLYRYVDFLRKESLFSVSEVVNIENNPYMTANLALLKINGPHPENSNKYYYIIAPDQIQIGNKIKGLWYDKIKNNFSHLLPLSHSSFNEESLTTGGSGKIGESQLIKNIPIGTFINNVEIKKGKGGKIARSAGTYCILLKTFLTDQGNTKSIIKLPSNKIIEIDGECTAVIGQISNPLHRSIILGKAGASRWLGIRPRTRGEAMNPVDHPHGGKSHGSGGLGNQPKNRWGKLAKWKPTKTLK